MCPGLVGHLSTRAAQSVARSGAKEVHMAQGEGTWCGGREGLWPLGSRLLLRLLGTERLLSPLREPPPGGRVGRSVSSCFGDKEKRLIRGMIDSLLLTSTSSPPSSLWAHAPCFLLGSPLLFVSTSFTLVQTTGISPQVCWKSL